mmetsp:Transcript_21866/g.61096  ORF Transcript_21866/g.61096 Transcript_21866/m.61096 type:complete len:265 (-) Transcript_21866:875-1669(-)
MLALPCRNPPDIDMDFLTPGFVAREGIGPSDRGISPGLQLVATGATKVYWLSCSGPASVTVSSNVFPALERCPCDPFSSFEAPDRWSCDKTSSCLPTFEALECCPSDRYASFKMLERCPCDNLSSLEALESWLRESTSSCIPAFEALEQCPCERFSSFEALERCPADMIERNPCDTIERFSSLDALDRFSSLEALDRFSSREKFERCSSWLGVICELLLLAIMATSSLSRSASSSPMGPGNRSKESKSSASTRVGDESAMTAAL